MCARHCASQRSACLSLRFRPANLPATGRQMRKLICSPICSHEIRRRFTKAEYFQRALHHCMPNSFFLGRGVKSSDPIGTAHWRRRPSFPSIIRAIVGAIRSIGTDLTYPDCFAAVPCMYRINARPVARDFALVALLLDWNPKSADRPEFDFHVKWKAKLHHTTG
jgi:hypothetical protein